LGSFRIVRREAASKKHSTNPTGGELKIVGFVLTGDTSLKYKFSIV
jgi:hypothetical protein